MSHSTDEIVRLEAQCESYRDQIGKLYRVCHEKTVLTLEVERLRKVVEDAARAWNKLLEMYAGQDAERAKKGEVGSIHRDVFESYLSGLAEDANASLTKSS